jgi:membrane-associated phospholipid phosphatase
VSGFRSRLASARVVGCLALALASLVASGPARAADPSSDKSLPSTTPGDGLPIDTPVRVAWNPAWPRFRPAEAALTGSMLLPIAAALFVYPDARDNIRGGFLFDNAIRSALVADSRPARDRAASFSNYPYWAMLAYPLLVDTALVTWGVHRAGDVALEMLAMNLEAYAISGGIALTFQKLGRVRPAEKGCKDDPSYSPKCDNAVALNQSFLSGHTAIAFTGAGLTCAHHSHLPLFGGGVADLGICLATLAAASSTGVLRIVADDHYASDVLLGVGLGLTSGYLMPELLHYTNEGETSGSLLPTFRSERTPLRAVLAPQIDAGYAGITLLGVY